MKSTQTDFRIDVIAGDSRKCDVTSTMSRMRIGHARCAFLLLGWCVTMACLVAPSHAASPPFDCFVASDLVRVFEDGYGTAKDPRKTINVFGLRNEIVSAQLVVRAHEDLKDLTIAIGRLQQPEGSASISGDSLRWNFVGSIFISTNTPKLQKNVLIRPAPAWFPDYLAAERQCSVRQGTQKSVYLTLQIPRDASPGEYRTDVTITANGASATVPLVLQIYPLALPEERHLMVTEWFSTGRFRKHHQVESSEDEGFDRMLKVYADNIAEHRQNVFRVGLDLIDCFRAADGQLRFDFSRFDRFVQVFWDTGRMDLLETGFVARFGEGGWSSSKILLRDFPVQDSANGQRTALAGEKLLPQFLPALVNHLREKGWLAKTVFHICDEPSNGNVMAWRKASEFVHRHAPELRRIDAIETPHCSGALEIWVPKLDHLATWQQAYEAARFQGNELWFYTVGIFQGGLFPNCFTDSGKPAGSDLSRQVNPDGIVSSSRRLRETSYLGRRSNVRPTASEVYLFGVAQAFEPGGSGDFPVARFAGLESPGTRRQELQPEVGAPAPSLGECPETKTTGLCPCRARCVKFA